MDISLLAILKRFSWKLLKFFTEHKKNFKEDDVKVTEFEFDLDEVTIEVDECLEKAVQLSNHLTVINEEIIQYLLANATAKQTK